MKDAGLILKWRRDPVLFAQDVFKIELDEWQKDGLMSICNNKRTAFKASKGVGKTALLAIACWWFITTRYDAKIVATSISGDNLRDGLWSELAKWQAKSEMLTQYFTWTNTRVTHNEKPETWFMSARQWSKSASSDQQANTLAGLHADNIMFVLDESGGIPSSVMAAAEAALANDHSNEFGKSAKIVQAGNPTHLSGPLYEASTRDRKMWSVIEISSDPDSPKRSSRVSVEWSRQQIEKYGRDNPWVLVNVFGEFPPSSANVLLGYEEVRAAMNRKVDEDSYVNSQKRLGIDVARFGSDSSVIFPRQGLMSFPPVIMRGARTNEISSRILQAKSKWQSEVEYVDGTGGFGSGVVDSLIQKGHSPQEIHFSSKPDDPRYFNKRAEMWFRMAEWIKRGGCLPYNEQLLVELTAPDYYFKGSKLILEDKDLIKEKIGSSPDLGDALALTFADVEMTTGLGELGVLNRVAVEKSSWDYDPLDPKRF